MGRRAVRFARRAIRTHGQALGQPFTAETGIAAYTACRQLCTANDLILANVRGLLMVYNGALFDAAKWEQLRVVADENMTL